MSQRPSTLLVEDHDGFADSLARVFTADGIRLERASTWDEGLARFRVGAHELVIADYNLPGSDHGLLLLLEIKVRMPATRLVLISGALTPAAEAELGPGGIVDAYFRKTATIERSLMPWVAQAMARADEPTDWKAFAQGHLSDPDYQRAEVARIDRILRASMAADD